MRLWLLRQPYVLQCNSDESGTKKGIDLLGWLVSAHILLDDAGTAGKKKKAVSRELWGREGRSGGSSEGTFALWCWRAQKSTSF